MYYPSEKSVYGASNAFLTLDDKFNATHGGTIYYGLEVERINWKGMDQESRRCDMENYETGTTKCITKGCKKEQARHCLGFCTANFWPTRTENQQHKNQNIA